MLRTRCPRCGHEILHHESEEHLVCDAVGCVHSFPRPGVRPNRSALTMPAGLRGENPPEVPPMQSDPSPGARPVLVTPHHCPQCQEAIPEAAGTGERTLTHTCGARVSLYALQFHTPCCGVYVETPQRSAGRPMRCPNCERGFTAPCADILHRRTGDVDRGEVLRWRCAHCWQRLQCNLTTRTGHLVVGRAVVCPACHALLEVPSCGDPVSPSA